MRIKYLVLEVLELQQQVLVYTGAFCQTAIPALIDKYVDVQEFAFCTYYAKTHPEMVENGMLILPTNPVSRDTLNKLFLLGMKILFFQMKKIIRNFESSYPKVSL